MQNVPLAQFDLWTIGIITISAVFIHACFQLGVSALTMLNAHTISRRLTSVNILRLNISYILGAIVGITLLALAAAAVIDWLHSFSTTLVWVIVITLLLVTALVTVLLYYRHAPGTQLWLPRPAADYILKRAKKTHSSLEAFTLGAATIIMELPFAAAPLVVIGLLISEIGSTHWLLLATLYAFSVALPLTFVSLYIGSGHKLSVIQRWREHAKSFLKWSSAVAMVLLASYLLVLQSGVQL